MIRPRKAVVLAAGFGTRLHPYTLDWPKALVPVRGTPALARTLETLHAWGVQEVAVNVHHLAELIVRELPALTPPGLRVCVSCEPKILGTGGALRRLQWFPDPDDPFWLCNADVDMELDPSPLLRAFADSDPLAALWMVSDSGPRTVRVEKGRVIDFRSGGMTFSGLHCLSPRILTYLPDTEQFYSVIDAYERGINAGETVCGVEVPGSRWADLGTPEQVLAASGTSVIFPGAQVAKSARLYQALVGPGARIRGKQSAGGHIVSPQRGLDKCERRSLPEVVAVELLPRRGSDRHFRRLYSADGTQLLIVSGTERPENLRWAGHARFLHENGIRVPEVYEVRDRGRWLRVEDAGRESLQDRHPRVGSAIRTRDLKKVNELTARLHACRVPSRLKLEPSFTSALYAWERKLFRDEFLSRFDPSAESRQLMRALRPVQAILLAEPQVLVHRDLQSSNILWCRGEPVLIDFQGMRMGPAAYDLASLFADPYLVRSREEQLAALEKYNQQAQRPVSHEAYAAGAVQRMVQALGAYGRLSALPGTSDFKDHIPAAVRQLRLWTSSPLWRDWADSFLKGQAEGDSL